MMHRLLNRNSFADRKRVDAGCPCDLPSHPNYGIFAQKDESLYAQLFRLSKSEASDICVPARSLAHSLFSCPDPHFSVDLTGRRSIQICREEAAAAGIGLVFLGECFRRPPRIVLYRNAIAEAAEELGQMGRAPDGTALWIDTVENAVLAHELYHLASWLPLSRKTELAAHCFARELMGLPFSPLLIESVLRCRNRKEKRGRV